MKKKKRLNLSLLIDLFFSPLKLDEQIFFSYYLVSRSETCVKFGNFFTNIVWKYWSTDSKKFENPCIIFLPEQFSQLRWTASFCQFPQIYFPFFFSSITLKKICFPIDAKRFPIDGDMQIVEFLYAHGHFSFTRTKASPSPSPKTAKLPATCRTRRRFKYYRRTIELFLDRKISRARTRTIVR